MTTNELEARFAALTKRLANLERKNGLAEETMTKVVGILEVLKAKLTAMIEQQGNDREDWKP